MREIHVISGITRIFLLFFSCLSFASIPHDNIYHVKKRTYAPEPPVQRFTISAYDQSFVTQPSIASYTQLNPLNPQAIYTIPPYPQTRYLPRLGKWMIIMNQSAQPTYLLSASSPQGPQQATPVPAHWISLINAGGQYIIEPINYVFIVYAKDSQKAVDQLHGLVQTAGFPGSASENHSGGYYAYMGDKLFSQLTDKTGQGMTYSSGDFRFQNDHFRLFGAYPFKVNGRQAFMFTASVSEESGLESELAQLSAEKLKQRLDRLHTQNANAAYYENEGHHFVSFANARNNLAIALIKAGYATYYSHLGNVVNTLGESTEDHDGHVYITVVSA